MILDVESYIIYRFYIKVNEKLIYKKNEVRNMINFNDMSICQELFHA